MNQFKIRCSAIGKIAAGNIGLTEKQIARIEALEARTKPMTANMTAEYIGLKHRRDNPELPATAKSYCKTWIKEQMYGARKSISTKYTRKGEEMEEAAIDFAADVLGLGFLAKNDAHYSNSFLTGTPDVVLADEIIDIKNSWDCFTFPFFADELPGHDYYWQGQGYMELTGRKKFKVIYCLMDTPENIIYREAKSVCYRAGIDDADDEQAIFEQLQEQMTYPDVPDEYKVKVFEFDYDPSAIEKIRKRVELCREYIEMLMQQTVVAV